VSKMRQYSLSLRQRYRKLSTWNKLGAWGSICSVIAVLLFFFPADSNKTNPGAAVRDTINVQNPYIPVIGSSNVTIVVYNNGIGQAATKEDIAKLMVEMRELHRKIESKPIPERAEASVKGFSVVLLASFRSIARPARKYILDTGACSLFFDAKNALRFAVRDSAGEEHSVALEQTPELPLFDQALFLACDAHCGERRSFLRIRVNGRTAATIDFDYDLKALPVLDKQAPVFGSSVDGVNPGSFTMMALGFTHSVLSAQQNRTFMVATSQLQKNLGRKVDIPGL
jgi:hypothetical protein